MKMNREYFNKLADIMFNGDDEVDVPENFRRTVMHGVIKGEVKNVAEELYPNHKLPSDSATTTIAKKLGRNVNQVAYYLSELIYGDGIFNWEWEPTNTKSAKVNNLLDKTFAEKNVQYMDVYTLAELFDMTVNSIIACVSNHYSRCEKYFIETMDCYDERGRRMIYVRRYKNR